MNRIVLAACLAVANLWSGAVMAAEDVLKLAVTTSFHNSGLSEILLPEIASDINLEVQLLIVGTGQALKLGRAGDVDAILVHSRTAEEAFVAEGYGTHRREIMYNDFVIIGPSDDPADVGSQGTASTALQALGAAKAPFVSRGDDSGNHKRELSLWRAAGLEPGDFDNWYRAVGSGMGAALNTASGMNAYILSDRASWLNFRNKGDLALLFSGDPVLFNQYAYLPVHPAKHSHVQGDLAAKLETWLTSAQATSLINAYQINGETLFTFNAQP